MWCIILAAAFLGLSVLEVGAEVGLRYIPCGYQQILTLTTAQTLTLPTPASCPNGPTLALITPETSGVRYRDDGTAPTATVGMPLGVGQWLPYTGTLNTLQLIQQSSGAIVNVLYYR